MLEKNKGHRKDLGENNKKCHKTWRSSTMLEELKLGSGMIMFIKSHSDLIKKCLKGKNWRLVSLGGYGDYSGI